MRGTTEDRFAAKYVIAPSGCFEWKAAKSKGGYGVFRVGSSQVKAHRWAYERANGPIPEGLVIDHLCRNTSCVNPDHLEAVTIRANIRRGNNGVLRTHCKNGHALTPENTRGRADRNERVCIACASGRARESRERAKAAEASA